MRYIDVKVKFSGASWEATCGVDGYGAHIIDCFVDTQKVELNEIHETLEERILEAALSEAGMSFSIGY